MEPQPAAAREAAQPPRYWLPVVLMAIYWPYQLVCRAMGLDMFVLWMSRTVVAALVYLTFFGWWLFSRRIRRDDRWFGLATAAIAGTLVAAVSDSALNAIVGGLPFVLTAWTLWLIAARRASPRAWRIGFASFIFLTWAPLALLRFEGMTGDQHEVVHWRWEPTAEERFFAEHEAAGVASPAPRSAAGDEPMETIPGDWTEFRGPQRDGVVHGVEIETDWKKHPPTQRWRRRVGPAWSSMCIVGGRLFTQEQRGERETVACYDAETGDEIWVHGDQTRFEEAVSGSGPRATPTFSGGHLYTSGATGRIKCLDAATGRVGWSRDLVAETGALPAFGFWGLSNSPMVVDGLVVAYLWTDCSSQLRALDAETGEPVWQIDVGKNNYSSPQLATLGGERQIILVGEQGLIAVEPAAGSVLWKGAEALKAMMAMVQPHPIADSELIVTTDAGLMRLAVERHGDVWNVENRWSAPSRALRPAYNDFVVHNDTIYGFDEGVFGCIDLATGKRRWKRGRYGHGQVLLLADQELLLVTSETGAVILLAADPATCRELGRFQAIEGKTWNHPVVAHGRLYVRNAEEMACFELTRDR